jgi:uracil-DNA glycosylase family 4
VPALTDIAAEVTACRTCPRLVQWREKKAREKRAAFAGQEYWGRGVPGFGDPAAWLLIVGLAPAAHGANRTGRMFTGDRSGDWLYGALYRAALASRPTSTSRDDGLRLRGVYVTAAVRCAPPDNKPSPGEREACRPYLEAELTALSRVRVIVTLGSFAYGQTLRILRDRGMNVPRPAPKFGHGVEAAVHVGGAGGVGTEDGMGTLTPHGLRVIASYHPSQQNTFTGRLTEPMFDSIWRRAREVGESGQA